MHLIRKSDAPLTKKEAEVRRYYLPHRGPLEVIETRMNSNASQEVYSHRVVREAMLVLEGTVSVEERVADQSNHQTLAAGDFVVFDCGVSHRIANKARDQARILHFKFLGEGNDRTSSIEDKNDTSTGQTLTTSVSDIYTQDYRHFDSLIWQVPAWASALFSFSITGAVLVLANSARIESLLPSIKASLSVSIFLLSVFVVQLLLLNVFLRFRLHQRVVFRPNARNVPRLWYMLSGQSSLLLVLFIEAAVTLCFALITANIGLITTICVTAIFLLLGFGYVERSVQQLSAILRSDRSKQHG